MSTVVTEHSTTAEKRALLSCAHLDSSDSDTFAEIAGDVRDWGLLLELSERHRLVPMLYRRLNAMGWGAAPSEVETSLRDQFHASAKWNLFLTTHLVELIDAFEKAQVRVIPFKGLVVAEAYYGSQLYRPVGDVDLVVAPEQLEAAIEAARGLGYRPTLKPDSEEYESTYGYHQTLVRGEVPVELHWRFSPPMFPLDAPFGDLWERSERVRIAERKVANLAPEDALILLSAHGTRHFWERLIWLVDVAQLIGTRPGMNWGVVFERARSLGCERIVALSLSLCEGLLSTTLPTEASDRISADDQIPELVAIVEQRLFQATASPITRGERLFVGVAARERLRDRVKFGCCNPYGFATEQKRFFPLSVRLWMLLIVAFSPHDHEWQVYHLPRRLRFLTYVLRPSRLVAKFGWRVLSGGSHPFSEK